MKPFREFTPDEERILRDTMRTLCEQLSLQGLIVHARRNESGVFLSASRESERAEMRRLTIGMASAISCDMEIIPEVDPSQN